MHQIFSPTVLTDNSITCPKCDWSGCGNDIKQEDLFLTDAIELYCPCCNAYLGFVSEPDRDDQ